MGTYLGIFYGVIAFLVCM